MNIRLPALAALVVALLGALACPSTALAFKRSTVPGNSPDQSGPCLWWSGRDLTYVVNKAGSSDITDDSEFTAVRKSFQTWTDVSCSDLSFVDQGLTDRTDVGYAKDAPDNIDLIVWRDVSCTRAAPSSDPCWSEGGCSNKFNCWDASPETIAVTTTTFNNKTGQIFDADIELNGAGFVFTTIDSPPCPKTGPLTKPPNCSATDVQNTITHEAGHFIGLDHTSVVDATMYASAETGEISKRTLENDDIQGICTIYPTGKPTVTCVQTENVAVGSGGCGCSSVSGLSPFALFAAAALVGLRASLRRRRAP